MACNFFVMMSTKKSVYFSNTLSSETLFLDITVTLWTHIFTEHITNTSQGNLGAPCADGVHDTLLESSLLVGVDS